METVYIDNVNASPPKVVFTAFIYREDDITDPAIGPEEFEKIERVAYLPDEDFSIMIATASSGDTFAYLGHWNV